MLKYLLILLMLLPLGCKALESDFDKKVVPNPTIVSTRYNKYTGEFYDDLWDKFMNAVKAGEVVYTFPKAAIIYLISNVEIFDSRPEESKTDFFDGLSVRVIIFRWRF